VTSGVERPAHFTVRTDALLLASMSSPVERRLLEEWRSDQRAKYPHVNVEVLELPAGKPHPDVLELLAALLYTDEGRSVVPVRVLWTPKSGLTMVSRLIGLLAGRDPYRPTERQQRKALRQDRSRARVVAGEPATVAALKERWQSTTAGDDPLEFAAFVIRRAVLAIERVEYRLLGPEYKSPRLVKPELLAQARFREGLAAIPGASVDEASKILDEMATGWSRLSVDLQPMLGRFIFRRGFQPDIDYDSTQVESMRRAMQTHPAVMLFSHRSNLDALVLAAALQENRLPRAHLFGGINMAFGFIGPLLRRSGVIFIRREFGNNPLYKYVLKQYVGYLAEKRFTLSWSIEGTRSRTGKMLPPKLGLLSYVAGAFRDGRTDDILLQPVSISFDQLHEIAEYAAYARGAEKKPEGIGWFYRFVKAQGERQYGKIYVRFPPPVSMRQYLGAIGEDTTAWRLALQKMAFEVAWRILQGTPINATGLVAASLLTTRGRALSIVQLHDRMQGWLDYLDSRGAPMTDSALQLRTTAGVRSAVEALSGGHPVTRFDGGREPVWRIAAEHEHEAAFYRNTIVHSFLETAIVELALAYTMRAPGDPVEGFWSQVTRVRDLLKFDFYFAESEVYRTHVAAEMAWCADWETRVRGGRTAIEQLLACKRPLVAAAMLRPFFEGYFILADVLGDVSAEADSKDLIKRALGIGGQYVVQGGVRSTESVSALLFATACQVAADQGLLSPSADLYSRRAAFADELRDIIGDLDRVEKLAAGQVL